MKKLICAVILTFILGSFSLANAADTTTSGNQSLKPAASKLASTTKSGHKHKKHHHKKKKHTQDKISQKQG